MSEICNKAIEIIQRTNDGDDLAPTDLKLVEMAVNGFLNEEGVKAFDELHKKVMDGTYKWPWFHGIEHMTQDHQGYILYKGKIVEHYDRPWAYSEEAKKEALELERRCKILESKGLELNNHNTIWVWEKISGEAPA